MYTQNTDQFDYMITIFPVSLHLTQYTGHLTSQSVLKDKVWNELFGFKKYPLNLQNMAFQYVSETESEKKCP